MSAKRSTKTVTAGNDIQELGDIERAANSARQCFEGILRWALSPEARSRDLHEVERETFAKLLELGRSVLEAHLVERGTGRAHAVEVGVGRDAARLPYHCEKRITYYSIFGRIRIPRAYFWAWSCGSQGVAPLDAELNLPERRYSYVIQELATLFAAQGPFDRVSEAFEKVFRIKIWKQALEFMAREAGADVQKFYEQKAPPAPETEGEILVVGLDGKGVPMVKTEPAPRQPRRYSGDKANKKKMAVVSTVHTAAPFVRSPEDVVVSLFREQKLADARVDRVVPQNKRVRATLFGVDAALKEVIRVVTERDPNNERIRVALVDGERRLVDRPEFADWTKILDIFHASEKLWEAGTAFRGEGSRETELWVRENLLALLSNGVVKVVQRIRAEAASATNLSWNRRDKLEQIARYYENNADRMRYGDYLKAGLPIGTGVVEGACGSLVNDRADRSGMRWTLHGAKAVLELRAIDQNGDWEEFWRWRIGRERARLYPERLRLVA
jgi:hypothetical protein